MVARWLCLAELPLLPAEGTLLLPILLLRELQVLHDTVHVEGMIALPPYCGKEDVTRGKRRNDTVQVQARNQNPMVVMMSTTDAD